MARNKSDDFKEFLVSSRKSMGASITTAPVWLMQKAGKRIYNKNANRHWRRTSFGYDYEKALKKQGKKVTKKKHKE